VTRPHSSPGALTPVEFAQLTAEKLIRPPRGKTTKDLTYDLTGIGGQAKDHRNEAAAGRRAASAARRQRDRDDLSVIERSQPTLLLDEGDSSLSDNEEIRGILNSAHDVSRRAYRSRFRCRRRL
jgi:hypothetical protein